jgi:hypothetical protein
LGCLAGLLVEAFAWRGRVQWKKGAGGDPHPFLTATSIISIRRGVSRQSFGIYFPILFMELSGESGKLGLDRICEYSPASRRRLFFEHAPAVSLLLSDREYANAPTISAGPDRRAPCLKSDLLLLAFEARTLESALLRRNLKHGARTICATSSGRAIEIAHFVHDQASCGIAPVI